MRSHQEAIYNHSIVNIPLIYDDYKSLVKNLINRQWQMLWSGTRCRLKTFKPVLGDWKSAYRDNRIEDKILSRLRTGSCYFLYRHIYNPDRDQEYCNTCNTNMSIEQTCP